MKKVIISVLMLAVVLLSLCACVTRDELSTAFDGITNAKSATQNIVVKSGNTEIAKESYTFSAQTGKCTVTKQVPNTDFDGEAWVTTTDTIDKDLKDLKISLTRADFDNLAASGSSHSGKLLPASLSKLGLQASDVKGDVKVEFTLSAGKLVSAKITYKSSNNNDVTITTTFTY